MAHTVASTIQNPAASLRASLDALESATVRPSAQTLEALLLQLDATGAAFAELEAQGVDLRAERVRWENLTRRLVSRPQLIANAAAGLPGGLAALRARHARTPEAAPWWGADLTQARRRRRLLTEIVAIVVGIPLALALIYWAVITLFPPDPAAVALIETEGAIDRAVADGRAADALPTVEAALAQYPDELSLAVWVALLAEQAGDAARAAEAAAQADTLAGENREALYLAWSDHTGRLGDAAASLDWARRAVEFAPESPQAWYAQGRAAVMVGDRQLAFASLDRVTELAGESSPELAVNARILYADLLQRPVDPAAEATLQSGAAPTSTLPAP